MQALQRCSLRLVVFTFVLCCSAEITGAAATGTAPVAKIPFIVGLTTVTATSTEFGDYELLSVIKSIDASG